MIIALTYPHIKSPKNALGAKIRPSSTVKMILIFLTHGLAWGLMNDDDFCASFFHFVKIFTDI